MRGLNKIPFSWPMLAGAMLIIFTAAIPTQKIFGAEPSRQETSLKMKGKRVGGIRGSPAYKRGWVLGFDAGYRIAKEDWLQDDVIKPSSHSNYNNAGDWYRYEYGSRAKFITGYKRGFLKGYQHQVNKQKTALEDSVSSE